MIDYPCFVLSCDGNRTSASFEEHRGIGRYLGAGTDDACRDMIKDFIRRHPDTNGLPLYFISDHGNVSRRRRITLRKGLQS